MSSLNILTGFSKKFGPLNLNFKLIEQKDS